MIRLVNPQGMDSFPESNWIRGWVESQDGRVEFIKDAFRCKWFRDDYEAHAKHGNVMNPPIAWSYTATTEPPVTSRGYVLPSWATKIDELTKEAFNAAGGRIYFLTSSGDLLARKDIDMRDLEDWTLVYFSKQNNIVGFYIAQPLERDSNNE